MWHPLGAARPRANPGATSRRNRRVPRECPINGASLCQVDLGVGLVGSLPAGPGSDWSEESVVGVEPAALDVGVAPECPPGPALVLVGTSRTSWR